MTTKTEITGVHPKIDKLLEIESRYPVERWKINDVHIWPILRTRLYIEMAVEDLQVKFDKNTIATTKSDEQPKPFSRIAHVRNRLINVIQANLLEMRVMKKSDALFVTPSSYNDQFEGKWYHKFFDPIRLENDGYKNSYILEIGKTPSGQIENSLHLDNFSRAISHFDQKHRRQMLIMNLEGYEAFCKELADVTPVISRFPRRAMAEAYYTIKKYEDLFRILLKKTGAKKVYGICYYIDSYALMGMNLAALHEGVESIDVQHGGQGPVHLAYSKFQRLPDSGVYEVMPQTFWCWDEASKNEIAKWCSQNGSKHKAIVGGQPWLNFIRKRLSAEKSKDLVVLVTLQPHGELIPEILLKTIPKVDPKVKWIMRLHPRTQSRRNELEGILATYHLNDRIHPDTWSRTSLPESIAKSSLHISRTSGSVIEASFMDVQNIILDPVGVDLYKELVAAGKAFDASTTDSTGLSTLVEKLLGLPVHQDAGVNNLIS